MPKIETLSSGVGQIETQATASALFDSNGMDSVSKELGNISESLQKMAFDEEKIKAARVFSDARQQWLLDFDKRKTASEESGQYQGFTQTFQKDYRSWMPSATKGIRNKEIAADLENRLIDLETGFLGDAISYESSQRGKILRENYERTLAVPIIEMNNSSNINDLNTAIFNADNIVDMLPNGEIKTEAEKSIKKVKYQNAIRLSVDDLENFDPLFETLIADETLDGNTKVALADSLSQTRNAGYNKVASSLEEDLKFYEDEAMKGALDPSWISGVNDKINKLPPDSEERKSFEKGIISIAELGKNIRLMSDMSDQQFEELILNKANQAIDVESEKVAVAEIDSLTKARKAYKESLSKDFAGTVLSQSEMARSAYDGYSQSLQDNSEAGLIKQKEAFSVYAAYLDDKAKKLGVPLANVPYLPETELDSIVQDIETSYDKRDGYLEVSQKIEQLRQNYGGKFKNVMRQLKGRTPELGALSVIPRIEENSGKNIQGIKNDIVRSITWPKMDKEIYSSIKPVDVQSILENSDYKNISTELLQSGMVEENQYRTFAYENLAKMYIVRDGKSVSDAAELARKAVFGDVEVFKNIVYPVSKSKSIQDIYTGGMSVFKTSNNIKPPIATLNFEMDAIKESPEDYIDFITSPDGSGIMPVWLNTFNEPVVNSATGQPFVFKWNNAELLGANIQREKSPYSPATYIEQNRKSKEPVKRVGPLDYMMEK